MLFNLSTKNWDLELLKAFDIPPSMVPKVRMSDAIFGNTDLGGSLEYPIPICALMGDSHSALFGHKCFNRGQAKVTYGTGSSVMANLGKVLPPDAIDEMAVSVAWGYQGEISYVLEGNIHHSGDTLKWFVDELGLFESVDKLTEEAATASSNGVFVVPSFSGLGAPFWNEHARGLICGLARGTKRAHIARAAIESLAFQVTDLLCAIRSISGESIEIIHADGGPTRNEELMQFQSDISKIRVRVSNESNASILGIAFMAGLSSGIWKDLSELNALSCEGKNYLPGPYPKHMLDGWQEALKRVL